MEPGNLIRGLGKLRCVPATRSEGPESPAVCQRPNPRARKVPLCASDPIRELGKLRCVPAIRSEGSDRSELFRQQRPVPIFLVSLLHEPFELGEYLWVLIDDIMHL